LTVVGARPQFIKAAVLSRLIRERYQDSLSEYLVHTGQHYDSDMSDIFFSQMRIPHPDRNLGIGSANHGRQTGAMLAGIEEVLLEQKPDLVLVYGDTNSTLAGALAASKLNIPVAHVEAGMRSYVRSMPEEQNRVVADHLSSILFCSTQAAVRNLEREGILSGVYRVGDIMYDASLFYRKLLAKGEEKAELPFAVPKDFYLLTLHRAENTDDPERLRSIVTALNRLSDHFGIFPAHPRTRKALREADLRLGQHILMTEPIGFLEMLHLEERCRFIVTDSGGVQKEAFFCGKPCITLRDQTEWVETVESGWNTLVGANEDKIAQAFGNLHVPPTKSSFYGEGDSGSRMLEIIKGG
jgi:UDP-GlcNAc3NAcA epimerase